MQVDLCKYVCCSGAPHILLKLVNNHDIELQVEKDVQELGERGIRCLAIAKTNASGKWEMVGLLTFLDPPRPDTRQTIEDAREFGVVVKMITGNAMLSLSLPNVNSFINLR